MKIRRPMCVAALAIVLLSGCTSARNAGRADAKRDIAHGILGLEVFGLQSPYIEEEYYPLLRQRYGIRVSGPGCLVTERVMEHADGYNEIMGAEMDRRFGTNFWRQAMAEAQRVYESKHKRDEEQK